MSIPEGVSRYGLATAVEPVAGVGKNGLLLRLAAQLEAAGPRVPLLRAESGAVRGLAAHRAARGAQRRAGDTPTKTDPDGDTGPSKVSIPD